MLEQGDLEEARDALAGEIDFEPTDAQLHQVSEEAPWVPGLAVRFGWYDTEVRKELVAALLEVRRDHAAQDRR